MSDFASELYAGTWGVMWETWVGKDGGRVEERERGEETVFGYSLKSKK